MFPSPGRNGCRPSFWLPLVVVLLELPPPAPKLNVRPSVAPSRVNTTPIGLAIVADEQMTTITLPKNLTYAFVFIGFVLMCFRSVQVAVANWRRGYSVLERPEAFDAPVVAET